MTVRAIVLGLLGAAFIAAVAYLNDYVAGLTYLVGNHFPNSVFGLLFILVVAVNPLLRRFGKGALRPAELAVTVALMLVACSVPTSGLMRYFPRCVVMPIQYNNIYPGWRKYDLMGYVPPSMMPAGGSSESKVLDGFLHGWGKPGSPIGLGDVPWDEWSAPLVTWIPLIFLAGLCLICLSLIVHRQWSRHESLRYPIAAFGTSLMGGSSPGGARPVFREKAFWIALLTVLAIHIINGLHTWYPGSIEIPLTFRLAAVAQKFPKIALIPGAGPLLTVRIFPTVVAFCFLLSSQVALSLGISQIAYVLLAAPLAAAGVDFAWDRMIGGVGIWQRFGSYFGIALVLAYQGRNYYRGVLMQAVTFRQHDRVQRYAAWACRIGLLATAAMIALLIALGLDWPLAVLFVLLLLMTFVVMARINAESGLFFFTPFWTPAAAVVGLFGFAALGPKAVLLLGLLSVVLAPDGREALMPYVVNALKMTDDLKVRPARVGWAAVGVFALALAIAVPVVLWTNQNYSAQMTDTWACRWFPPVPFNAAERTAAKLAGGNQLEQANQLAGWDRIRHIQPQKRFLWAAGAGLGLVLLISSLRRRFVWWPLHPVMFAVWDTFALWQISYSFLLGWFIRKLVTGIGGAGAYRKARPIVLGVIAGELMGGLVFMAVGALYYSLTGLAPKEYRVFSI